MASRTVYGNTISENGWPMVDPGSCTWVTVPGCAVSLEIQNGQPLAILRAFAADFNAYVEPLRDADSACWTETNSVSTSNHLSGTAMDLNWNSHPFRTLNAGFNAAMIAAVRDLLDFYEDTIWWGNDWSSPKDAMHFQMGYNTYGNPHTADFIARKIRADGYSTFRRTAQPVTDAALVLAQATGLAAARCAEILPAITSGLQQSDCTTPTRIAMWLAQIGHESGSFVYTEEIASGAAYEGRTDLGNAQPGDGARFKGRTWIQITGRTNYLGFSRWASARGICSTPTYFIDNPTRLAELQYAGVGAAWYWTVARPDINELSDAGDLDTVTWRINGGTNGIADRRARYSRALAAGDQLLTLTTATTGDNFMSALTDAEQRELLDLMRWLAAPGTGELRKRYPSRSPLRHLGEGLIDTLTGIELNDDGNDHVQVVIGLALVGHQPSIALLGEVAGADPRLYPDRQDDAQLARQILTYVKAVNPAALELFASKAGAAA